MVEKILQQIASSLDATSDFGLHILFEEISSLLDFLKKNDKLKDFQTNSDYLAIMELIKQRAKNTASDEVAAACLDILFESESIFDTEFAIQALMHATRKMRTADSRLYAAVRLALSVELLSDVAYLEICPDGNMSALEVDKHLGVAERILHSRQIPTNVG